MLTVYGDGTEKPVILEKLHKDADELIKQGTTINDAEYLPISKSREALLHSLAVRFTIPQCH